MSNQVPPSDESLELYLRQRRFARESALQFLYQADIQGEWDSLPERLKCFWQELEDWGDVPGSNVVTPAMPFAERLINGVSVSLSELDVLIAESAHNWSIPRMAVIDRNILRIAAYELFHCDDVPPVTAVDEAIELAKSYGDKESGRFVNGVLDSLLRKCRLAEQGGSEAVSAGDVCETHDKQTREDNS